MENEKKNFSDQQRPRDVKNWDTNHCPWFIFGDEDAAKYDLEKAKSWFTKKFGRKKKRGCSDC